MLSVDCDRLGPTLTRLRLPKVFSSARAPAHRQPDLGCEARGASARRTYIVLNRVIQGQSPSRVPPTIHIYTSWCSVRPVYCEEDPRYDSADNLAWYEPSGGEGPRTDEDSWESQQVIAWTPGRAGGGPNCLHPSSFPQNTTPTHRPPLRRSDTSASFSVSYSTVCSTLGTARYNDNRANHITSCFS